LHGLHAPYNTIPQWDYTTLFKAFAPELAHKIKTWKMDKADEVDKLLEDADFRNADYPQCVEVVMDKLDFPRTFKGLKFA
jgi:TPP-dependent 2-oxoacid decarboxylase